MHKSRKIFAGIMMFLLCAVGILILENVEAYADVVYVNEDNGYEVIIDDEAELLSRHEENELQNTMEKITKWGNAAFKTIDSNPYISTERYIVKYYREIFGSDSGIVFLIDMDERNIWIFSDGKIYDTVTKSYADTITDNVYKYASDAEYYKCSNKAFEQIYRLLSGKRIAQPMKYISNAFLAVILALIINYFIIKRMSETKKTKNKELLEGMEYHCMVNNINTTFTHQTKKYDPPSKSSGGGGGGGGRSGGGGGHSF